MRELLQWRAWDAVQPIGDERCFDLPAAMIRRTALNVAGCTSVPSIAELMPFRGTSAAPIQRFEDFAAQFAAE